MHSEHPSTCRGGERGEECYNIDESSRSNNTHLRHLRLSLSNTAADEDTTFLVCHYLLNDWFSCRKRQSNY